MKKVVLRFLIGLAFFLIGFALYTLISGNIPFDRWNSLPPVGSLILDNSQMDETEIYRAILADRRSDSETLAVNSRLVEFPEGYTELLRGNTKHLPDDLLGDFLKKTVKGGDLENDPGLGKKIFLIEPEELSEIVRRGDEGWDEFHRQNPGSGRIISFSRIGFNRERTIALVYVSINCKGLCDEWVLIPLQKKDGKWAVGETIGLLYS
ncbi:MAG: hypothetical protein R2747_02085 [Pyrinomonadaceae bacterium]